MLWTNHNSLQPINELCKKNRQTQHTMTRSPIKHKTTDYNTYYNPHIYLTGSNVYSKHSYISYICLNMDLVHDYADVHRLTMDSDEIQITQSQVRLDFLFFSRVRGTSGLWIYFWPRAKSWTLNLFKKANKKFTLMNFSDEWTDFTLRLKIFLKINGSAKMRSSYHHQFDFLMRKQTRKKTWHRRNLLCTPGSGIKKNQNSDI